MNALRWTMSLMLLAACGASVSFQLTSCTAVDPRWQPLVDEPSRADLFRDFARAERIKHPEASFSFALPYTFEFPHDAIVDTNGASRENELFGLDISHHQGRGFPFQLLKDQGISFIYVKATQGTTFMDNAFADNWRALGALDNGKRVPRGAYHFLSSDPNEPGEDQADRFVEFVNLAGGFRSGDLPPALDLEWDKACASCNDRWAVNQRTPDDIIGVVTAFAKRIKSVTGRTPILYTNKSFLSDHQIQSNEQINKLTQLCLVWIFDLAAADRRIELPDPDRNLGHVLWQFTWAGTLGSQYSQTLDVSVYKDSAENFKKTFLTGS